MTRTILFATLLGWMITSPAFSQLQRMVLEPSETATITDGAAEGASESRVLVEFDLSAIPENASIQYAGLMLTDDNGVPWDAPWVPVLVGALTKDWDQSASWDAPSSGDSWDNPGGDWGGGLTAYRVLVAEAEVPAKFLVSDVIRKWLASEVPNYGFVAMMTEAEEQSDFASLFSATHLRPSLQIRYIAPSSGTGTP
jgi:hypothetical protein